VREAAEEPRASKVILKAYTGFASQESSDTGRNFHGHKIGKTFRSCAVHIGIFKFWVCHLLQRLYSRQRSACLEARYESQYPLPMISQLTLSRRIHHVWRPSALFELKNLALVSFIFLTSPNATAADAPLNYFLHAYGPAATATQKLGWVLTSLALAVCVIIGALLGRAIWRARTPTAPENLIGEAGGMNWIYVGVGISTVALVLAAVYMLVVLQNIADPPTSPSLTISVVAYDWWWRVDYRDPDPARHFVSANEIHIPVGQPVRVLLQSADVIHAFWVPELAGKTQAIPGQTNEQWLQADRAGVFRGQCTQYCGAQHAHMAFEVIAEPPTQFSAWADAQRQAAHPPAATDLQAWNGQHIFSDRCAACHTVRGSGAAGVQAPDLTHIASRRMLAAGTLVNTPANLIDWVTHAQQIKPGSLMPTLPLTASDAIALSAYMQTLR
jgi:cytochrome c oxidase subunit 2